MKQDQYPDDFSRIEDDIDGLKAAEPEAVALRLQHHRLFPSSDTK